MSPITAHIDGAAVSREEVLAWEEKRAAKVLRKLGAPASGDLAGLRRALLARKRELGHEAIERLLAGELRRSEIAGRLGAAVSRGRRRMCSIELTGTGASVEGVPARRAAGGLDDLLPAVVTSPRDVVVGAGGDQRGLVVRRDRLQFAVRMFFDDDVSTLRSEPDPSFPVEWASVARDATGRVLGGVRHLFRDGPDGFRVRLTVEFPAGTLPHMIREHRWHLACEFSNWIESADAARTQAASG